MLKLIAYADCLTGWLAGWMAELLPERFTLYDDVKVNFSSLLNGPTLKCKLLLGHFSLSVNTNIVCVCALRRII